MNAEAQRIDKASNVEGNLLVENCKVNLPEYNEE